MLTVSPTLYSAPSFQFSSVSEASSVGLRSTVPVGLLPQTGPPRPPHTEALAYSVL